MIKNLIVLLFLAIPISVTYTQNFEGKVTYKVSYETKNPEVTDHLWETRLGTELDFYFKTGNYKVNSNGALVEWQLYLNKTNKIYKKIKDETSVFGTDASMVVDSLVSYETKEEVKAILGHTCKQIILICKGGTYEYHYSNKFKLDFNQYSKHEFDNWASYLKLSGSVPLKIVIENKQYRLVMTAINIEPIPLDDSLFVMPPELKIIKAE